MSEDELRAYMKKMEKSKEELKFQEQRIWREEDEKEEQIYAAMVGLERMREKNSILFMFRITKCLFNPYGKLMGRKKSQIQTELIQ